MSAFLLQHEGLAEKAFWFLVGLVTGLFYGNFMFISLVFAAIGMGIAVVYIVLHSLEIGRILRGS